MTARAQHAGDFGEGLRHQRQRNVMKRLEHQRHVENRVREGDGLCAACDEAQPGLRRCQVLGWWAFKALSRQLSSRWHRTRPG